VIGTLMLYLLTARFAGIPVLAFAKALWPVQVLAFSTRSSAACLPAMLDAAHSRLHVDQEVSGFVLPFAVATFKFNMGISAIFQMFFLLHVYGIEADPVSLAVAMAAVTAQSVATPGLPSGAIWTTTPVYMALGIPLEGIVLTNVVDTIPDLFKTTANVTGDLSIAAIVAERA
jgi:Na+/H+-dicarboxylate symporter